MADSIPEKILASVSIDLADNEARIDKLPADETGPAGQTILRIWGGQKGASMGGPLTLSEEQLIDLLYKAIHAGVISNGFIGKLREKIEI